MSNLEITEAELSDPRMKGALEEVEAARSRAKNADLSAAEEGLRVELGLGPDDLRRPDIRAQYADEIEARANSGKF